MKISREAMFVVALLIIAVVAICSAVPRSGCSYDFSKKRKSDRRYPDGYSSSDWGRLSRLDSNQTGASMSRAVQITCDVCGKQKQESNHWFTIAAESPRKFTIMAGTISDERKEGDSDLCGEACVLKKVSELIGTPKC